MFLAIRAASIVAIAWLQAALREKYVASFRVKCDCAGDIAGLRPDKPPAPEPAG